MSYVSCYFCRRRSTYLIHTKLNGLIWCSFACGEHAHEAESTADKELPEGQMRLHFIAGEGFERVKKRERDYLVAARYANKKREKEAEV